MCNDFSGTASIQCVRITSEEVFTLKKEFQSMFIRKFCTPHRGFSFMVQHLVFKSYCFHWKVAVLGRFICWKFFSFPGVFIKLGLFSQLNAKRQVLSISIGWFQFIVQINFLRTLQSLFSIWGFSTQEIFTLICGSLVWIMVDEQNDVSLRWRKMTYLHDSLLEWQNKPLGVSSNTYRAINMSVWELV